MHRDRHEAFAKQGIDKPMLQFAFSTVACPQWSLKEVIDQATAMGYQGIELRTLDSKDSPLANDPATMDLSEVTNLFAKTDIAPVCLSTSESLHDRDNAVIRTASKNIIKALDTAKAIGCPLVRVFGNEVLPGESRRIAMTRIIEHVKPLAQEAARRDIGLIFENSGSFADAKSWWTMFNVLEESSLGVCWNVANAAAINEAPAVSVPLLNRYIQLAKVKDTIIGEGTGYVPLGEGTVKIQNFIHRLMGIGFGGYVSVEWDKVWLPSLASSEEYLPQAKETLEAWQNQASEAIAAAQVKIDKAAAKLAPKPRRRAS